MDMLKKLRHCIVIYKDYGSLFYFEFLIFKTLECIINIKKPYVKDPIFSEKIILKNIEELLTYGLDSESKIAGGFASDTVKTK